jgi:AraC-like DNA-binding protein/mannose-6-phosphate isomerase-like protein (cupin superfamily)
MKFANLMESEEYYLHPVQYYLKTFDSSYRMTTHSHDYFEIMFAESGDFELLITLNQKSEKVTITEGQFIFIDSNVIHKMNILNKVKIYNFEFTLSRLKMSDLHTVTYLKNIPSFLHFLKKLDNFIILNDSGNILNSLKSIHSSLAKNKEDKESFLLIQAQLLSLLIEIGRCSTELSTQSQSIYVTKMLNIIDKNLNMYLSPKKFSEYLNVSASYLQRLFKQNTGSTIIDYINEKRVRHAMNLLSSTNDPVIDIAIAVGFNTRQNFGQIFKKFTNITPSEYRNTQKKKEYDIPILKDEIYNQKSYIE